MNPAPVRKSFTVVLLVCLSVLQCLTALFFWSAACEFKLCSMHNAEGLMIAMSLVACFLQWWLFRSRRFKEAVVCGTIWLLVAIGCVFFVFGMAGN